MLTEGQRKWMLEKEAMIRKEFPGDPIDNEKDSDQFIKRLDEFKAEGNGNPVVTRWLQEIAHEYNDRHIILSGRGHTDHEWAKAFAAKYGTKGVSFDGI